MTKTQKTTQKYKYHYVYRITNKIMNKHYYGAKSTNNPNLIESLKQYKSSSTDKEFIKDQKENPQNYKYKVVKQFETREEANKYEKLILVKFKADKNPSFYNLHIPDEKFNNYGMIVVNDLRNNTTKRVSTEDYYKHEYYVSISSGYVSCIDTRNNTTKRVSTEDYYKHEYYVAVNTGRDVSVEERNKMSIRSKLRYENNPKMKINLSKIVTEQHKNRPKEEWNEIVEKQRKSIIKTLQNKSNEEKQKAVDNWKNAISKKTEKEMELWSIRRSKSKSGKNHPMVNIILFFDNFLIPRYICDSGVDKFCKIHNLPCSVFKTSYLYD